MDIEKVMVKNDENGNMVYKGFFKYGVRMNIVEMKGYCKEMSDANEVISIFHENEEGRNDGICYFYISGKIDKVNEWKNDE